MFESVEREIPRIFFYLNVVSKQNKFIKNENYYIRDKALIEIRIKMVYFLTCSQTKRLITDAKHFEA